MSTEAKKKLMELLWTVMLAFVCVSIGAILGLILRYPPSWNMVLDAAHELQKFSLVCGEDRAADR